MMDAIPWLRWLRRSQPATPRLSDLPDDILSRILTELMQPVRIGPNFRIVEASFMAALPLAQTSTRFLTLFYQQLIDCELWQSGRLDDGGLIAIARHANQSVRRMILRKCDRLSIRSLSALAHYCPNVRTIDLSYMPISDDDLAVVAKGTARSLRSLLVRGCTKLTDASLHLIGSVCHNVDAIDVCALPLVTDDGIAKLAEGLGERLTMIVFSECKNLTDAALDSLSAWCTRLEVVTCRGLPLISNAGLDALCRGAGENLAILDILDCDQLKAKGFLDSARRYCPRLVRRYESMEGRSLRQIVISSLSGFIFHVTGSDIHNGKAAVYFLLVDSGTSNSFRVSIGSSSLDLTNYGSILASCFGEAPNEQVKQTLLTLYGLDLDVGDTDSHGDV